MADSSISRGITRILQNLLDEAKRCIDRGEGAEALVAIAQAQQTIQAQDADEVEAATISDLAAFSEALIRRQNGLFQVCAILRCAARRGDDVNSEADTLYAIEAADELLTPIAEGLDLAVLRQEAQGDNS